jgi:hypothetical protein
LFFPITWFLLKIHEAFVKYLDTKKQSIVSEEEMRAAKPDYLLVLPWHFIDEFVKREQDFIAAGGKLVVPCPTFQVIG